MELTMSPRAYWHLHWLCQRTPDEVSCMGILAQAGEFRIQDVILVKQIVSTVSVDLDMVWWADKQVELYEKDAIEPWQTSAWIHTHPQGVKKPSATDEETMAKSFGSWDFAVMIILTKDDHFYARVDFTHAFAGGIKQRYSMECPISVDWNDLEGEPVTRTLAEEWEEEFKTLVTSEERFWKTDLELTDKPGEKEKSLRSTEDEVSPEDFGTREEVEDYVDSCAYYGLDPGDPESFESLYGFWPTASEFVPF